MMGRCPEPVFTKDAHERFAALLHTTLAPPTPRLIQCGLGLLRLVHRQVEDLGDEFRPRPVPLKICDLRHCSGSSPARRSTRGPRSDAASAVDQPVESAQIKCHKFVRRSRHDLFGKLSARRRLLRHAAAGRERPALIVEKDGQEWPQITGDLAVFGRLDSCVAVQGRGIRG
jgi:hypothetical protein